MYRIFAGVSICAALILTSHIVALAGSVLWGPGPSHFCYANIEVNDNTLTPISKNCPPATPQRINGCSWFGSPTGECPTWYNTIWNWENYSDYRDKYPGWAWWNIGTGNFTILNNAKPSSVDACTQREVGFSWSWNHNSFKSNTNWSPINIYQFNDLIYKFTAKFDSWGSTPRCSSSPAAYVTADLVVSWVNSSEQVVRNDILSVLIANPSLYDMDGNPNNIFYYNNGCSASSAWCVRQVYAWKVGHPGLGTSWLTYNMDLHDLYFRSDVNFPGPPPGLSTSAARVNHVQIYSAVKGTDLKFSVKNQDVIGNPF